MPAAAKFAQVWGFLAALETTYNDGTSLSASTDGILPYLDSENPPAPESLDYVYDGNLGRAPGTLAPQLATTPNGRFRRISIPVQFRGAGTAYSSAAVVPPNEVKRLLEAAGYDFTFDVDHWDVTPTDHGAGFSSLALADYRHGEEWAMDGVIANWSYTADGLGVPVHTFECLGLASLPDDAALPTITYGFADVIPPVAAGATISIGDFGANMVVRSVSFNRNRAIESPRIDQTAAGGHAGFVPGATRPTWEITVEKTALATTPFHAAGGLDPDRLRANATSIALSIRYGSTATNRWTHGSAQAQVVGVQHGNDGNVATVTLTLVGHSSDAASNDAEYLLFD